MSTLTLRDVEHVARLARLELDASEMETYLHDMTAMLDYAARLDELELDGVPRTTHAVAQHNVLRPDVVNSALITEKALANAAAQQANQFAIQAVFDE